MSCRFPGGANSPEDYWDLLKSKGDAIGDIPAGRFNLGRFVDPNGDKTGNSYVGKGGFLDWNPELFEPAPFKISPREAANMDPQQRLLLQLTQELFFRAGYATDQFKGEPVGVFIGGFCVDNLLLKLGPNNWDEINAHTATGSTLTMLANRLSHTFDFNGPSFTLDTACSSSLVALHQGVSSLQNGECEMAVVGGSNIIMSPEYYIAMSKGHFLSPRGRCATFDVEADGYVRGEGAGLLLLKPLEQALADKDPILATIEASGINQDGHTPGITLPSMNAQADLLSSLFERSGLSPADIGYVEAHGTGTQAGDKAETTTLKTVFGDHLNEDDQLYVGSVKTNIGHLEAAAGVAGVIKSLLILQHESIPANLHLNEFNPALNWDDRFVVPQDQMDHPTLADKPAILVNSFGYGGTNAMVLLKRPEGSTSGDANFSQSPTGSFPLPVSAFSHDSLQAHLQQIQATLPEKDTAFYSYLYSLSQNRSDGPYRKLIWFKNRKDLSARIEETLAHKPTLPGAHAKTVAFVYSGMGPHWWGMGQKLYRTIPLFKETLDQVDALFNELSGFSFIEAMGSDEKNSRIGQTEVDQPAGFGLQVALTTVLRSFGLTPDCVQGHSLGEVAAFWACGLLSLEDAVCVIYHRSRLQGSLRGRGGMLATALDLETANDIIADFDKVGISAANSPNMVTLGGHSGELETIAARLNDKGIFNRFLRVEVAYHSHYMEEIGDELRDSLSHITFKAPDVPLYSTVTGQEFTGDMTPADYWWGNVRQPVDFQAGFSNMIEELSPQVLEIGPHPVLTGAIQENLYTLHKSVPVHYSLHRDKEEQHQLQDILTTFYQAGFELEWSSWYPTRSVVTVPTPVVEEKNLWVESPLSRQCRFGLGGSPYLLNRVNVPGILWAADITQGFFPWLFDHRVQGEIAFPGAGYIDAMMAAVSQMPEAANGLCLKDVELRSMWLLNKQDNFTLFTQVDAAQKSLQVFSAVRNQLYSQQLNAVCTYSALEEETPSPLAHVGETELDIDDFYSRVRDIGFQYDESFQVLKSLSVGKNSLQMTLSCDAGKVSGHCYPPLLDGVFQSVLAFIVTNGQAHKSYVPYSMGELRLLRPLTADLKSTIEVIELNSKRIRLRIWITDQDDTVLMFGDEIQFIALPQAQRQYMDSHIEQWQQIEDTSLFSKDYDLHPASEPFSEIATLLEEASPHRLLFLESQQVNIETILFEQIIPWLKKEAEDELLVVVARQEDEYPLANMLHGLIQVIEKEDHQAPIRLVFGDKTHLITHADKWMAAVSSILKISADGLSTPEMVQQNQPTFKTAPAHRDMQLYFNWPLDSQNVEQGENRQEDRFAIDALSTRKIFGSYAAICHKKDKPYLGLLDQAEKRFVSGDEIVFAALEGAAFTQDIFSRLAYSAVGSVFDDNALLPSSYACLAEPSLEARAVENYLNARGITRRTLNEIDKGQCCVITDCDLPAEVQQSSQTHLIINLSPASIETAHHFTTQINLAEFSRRHPEKWRTSFGQSKDRPLLEINDDLIFDFEDSTLQVIPKLSDTLSCALITGGTGGFGLKLAFWLKEKGVKRILLTSRSGKLKEETSTPLPAEIEIHSLDVCDEQAVQTFLADHPVDGIFHAAMVLEDQRLTEMDRDTFRKVLAPKVSGADILDKYSRKLALQHFVLFSSIASAIGNQNQAAYVIANRYLESMAQTRCKGGLPGLAVQWGAIADAGVVKRNEALQKILAAQGIEAIKSRDAFERLEFELINQDHPVMGIYRLADPKSGGVGGALNPMVLELKALDAEERKKRLLEISTGILASVLKLDESEFPLDTALSNLGLDSLMIIEVLMDYEAQTGMSLPSTLFMKQYSTSQLVEQINQLIMELEE